MVRTREQHQTKVGLLSICPQKFSNFKREIEEDKKEKERKILYNSRFLYSGNLKTYVKFLDRIIFSPTFISFLKIINTYVSQTLLIV